MTKEGTTENLQKKIGYGHGTTVGYSVDGMVFMTIDVEGPDGAPMQTMLSCFISKSTTLIIGELAYFFSINFYNILNRKFSINL